MKNLPTPEEVNEALAAANALVPSSDFWGLFAYSDAPPIVCGSGMGSFLWFDSKVDMLRFVHDLLSWWHPAPSSMEPEDIAKEVQSVIVEAGKTPDLAQLRGQLNEHMRHMWCIEWWGQFKELTEGSDKFPIKLRGQFFEHLEDDASASTRPISDSELDEFKQYLSEYGF